VIHLDTGFLIRSLVPESPEDTALRRWLGDAEELGMSAIAWTEFLCGPLSKDQAELALRIVTEIAGFLEEDAVLGARLFNEGGRRRGSLVDCMIAAAALRVQAVLATTNPADFRRFESTGLEVFELKER
jgi:predicted nucleic acid-binding protein